MAAGSARARAEAIAAEVRALPVRNTPAIRKVRQAVSRELRDAPAAEVVALAHALRDVGLRWVGYEILTHHKPALASLDIAGIEALAEGLASWDGVDTFGVYIAGPAWRAGQIADADVLRWTQSPDLWRRRSALVATVVLNSKSRGDGGKGGDAARTLAVVERLIDDREDMVVKAVSWALRTLAAVDPQAARAFIAEHRPRLAARVLRETRNKLETGLKSPKPAARRDRAAP